MIDAPADKSVGAALVLTFFFGPLGLFYASIMGGAVMTVIGILVAIFTLGLGLLLVWPITMVWGGVVASNKHRDFEEWRIRAITGR